MSRNLIHYYPVSIGPVSDRRAMLHVDVVVDDRIVPELSGPVGSPAPYATVAACEHTVYLTPAQR